MIPTVVAQLEGDRSKITSAITIGTALPFVMFVTWNAVILGNFWVWMPPAVLILYRFSKVGSVEAKLSALWWVGFRNSLS